MITVRITIDIYDDCTMLEDVEKIIDDALNGAGIDCIYGVEEI